MQTRQIEVTIEISDTGEWCNETKKRKCPLLRYKSGYCAAFDTLLEDTDDRHFFRCRKCRAATHEVELQV